jgi:hypothetical protein
MYFDISFTTVTSEPELYRLLTFHIPNLISIFLSLSHLSKESVQVTNLFFMVRSSASCPTPKLIWWTTPCQLQRLLIQYIPCCPPYLEAVSSIHYLRTCHVIVARDPLIPFQLSLFVYPLRILALAQWVSLSTKGTGYHFTCRCSNYPFAHKNEQLPPEVLCFSLWS